MIALLVDAVPASIWAALMGMAAIAAAWLTGRLGGAREAKGKDIARRIAAIQRKRDIENEVEALDGDTLKRRATVWVRDDKR